MLKIKDLYKDQSYWCQGISARNNDGCSVTTFSPQAVAFCLSAAIVRVYGTEQLESIRVKIALEINPKLIDLGSSLDTLIEWNDSPKRKFEEVKALVEKLDMSPLTVINKKNGDKAIYLPLENLKDIAVVTLQKDGEIRWASIGPQTIEETIYFSDAIRLALHLSGIDINSGGLCWQSINERG